MSATTTANPRTTNTISVLADYEIHHTGDQNVTAPAPNSHSAPSAQSPSDWDQTHRRVPPHRPINYDLDQSQRRVYMNTPERVFIFLMFTGVWTQATASQIWRRTGGRFNENIFKYRIGGEF